MGLKSAGGQGKNFKDWQEITQSDLAVEPFLGAFFYFILLRLYSFSQLIHTESLLHAGRF